MLRQTVISAVGSIVETISTAIMFAAVVGLLGGIVIIVGMLCGNGEVGYE